MGPHKIHLLDDLGEEFRSLRLECNLAGEELLRLADSFAGPPYGAMSTIANWVPLRVRLRDRRRLPTDVPHLMAGLLVFSSRATQVLKRLLRDSGDFHEVILKDETLMAFSSAHSIV